jgi:hypothetical protein
MEKLLFPVLLTLLIIGLLGILLRIDKLFFKRKRGDEEDAGE